ncbi:MAG TPA: protein kinase [Polyangia bacterium]|nr:protein kinase [Polyangia bacterium]
MSSPSEPSASKPDPLLDRVIAGNFRVHQLLGSGAMGNVYRAEQLSLGKSVAIKVLHPHLMGDDKLVLRFKREAKNASMLNHPNSIQIIDSGQDRDGTLYIAMELLAGRDLAHVIRDDFPLAVPRIVRIMSQVLSALDEAHTQGVIHRDLKPSNIMLIERRGESDFVKVCDFGIAKAAATEKEDRANMLTVQGLVCGTPEYMAPEQARGEPLDGRADLYAAAVILFQMVTGDIPFKGDTPMAIVSRHLVEQPVLPSRRRSDVPIPAALDALILKGMEKSRELRFPTAVAFREALETIDPSLLNVNFGRNSGTAYQRAQMPTAQISGTGATAVVPSSDPANHFGATTQLPRRTRRGPVVAAFALVLAGGAALILRGQKNEQEPPPAAEATMLALPASAPVPPAVAAAAAVAPALPPATGTAPAGGAENPAAAATTPTGPTLAPPAPQVARTSHTDKPDKVARKGGPEGETPAGASAAAARAAIAARSAPAPKRKGPDKPPAAEPPLAAATPKVTAAPSVIAAAGAGPGEDQAGPAPRGAREVLTEGEKLLGQGEVRDACAHGEEAKRMNPKLPAIYKFLGKCYNRAGDAGQANVNYKKYLELAPNAPDAMFIKSILK